MGFQSRPCCNVPWDRFSACLARAPGLYFLVCNVTVQGDGEPRVLGLGPRQQGCLGRLLSAESRAGVCIGTWNVQRPAGLEIRLGGLLGLWGTRAMWWPSDPGEGSGAVSRLPPAWLSRPQSTRSLWTVRPRGWDPGPLAFITAPDPGKPCSECLNE